ncbi:hypothetical protein Y1Q_0017503 [Alligator mississippiensis]|nr:hypothetical protein Y1Q_0017503 [Alligator mississippiensis]
MAERGYSFSLTTFSPSGKLVQIEYALAAVAAGAPSVGIKAANGVVLATEKKQKSILYDERSVHKVESITKHIGLVYSGMGPDYRVLVHRARKLAQQYYLVYHEPIPTAQLVQRIASVMQEYTQSGGVRPFGVSLLICGWNEGRPYLFQSDPSGAYFAWKATAMGKNYVNGKTFLEKRYNEDLELEDAIHTAILTLKESFEGQMTEDNIEVGICNEAGFRRLTPTEVKDYLAAIAYSPHRPVGNNVTNMSVHSLLCDRIAVAKELIKRAEALSRSYKGGIEGGAKLCSKLKAELKFLLKVEGGKVAIKESHLQSTNLTHLQAIIESAENLEDVVSILHVFAYEDKFGEKQMLVVDVVANGGHTWVKAIGRKAEALHNIWLGRGQYGDKSIIEQAEDFLQASHQQPVQYSNPHIIFAFYNSVSSPMAERLKEMGISVRGDIVAVNSLVETSNENRHLSASESDEESPELLQVTSVDRENLVASVAFPTAIKVDVCNRVNLDITTLITYVSALSYGGCYFIFREKVLTEQAAQERKERVLPQLEDFMKGKELFACESAVKDFQSILETLGGPGEKERAMLLIRRVNVVPDQPSDRALTLVASSKINSRSLTIFGTGDTLKAITVTANIGFVRAAANQGVKFSVFIHQPRALTESKESVATPLPKNCTAGCGL